MANKKSQRIEYYRRILRTLEAGEYNETEKGNLLYVVATDILDLLDPDPNLLAKARKLVRDSRIIR